MKEQKLARATYAVALRRLSPPRPTEPEFQALDEGTLAAGTLVRSVSGPARDGVILFEASTDGGESWHWQRTYVPLELEGD